MESIRRSKGIKYNKLKIGIEFVDVSFCYPGTDNQVLTNINIEIPSGQTVAFVGPSGAGKSTIIDLLLGLYEPTEGEIRVDQTNLNQIGLDGWRERIGVVDQEVFLLNSTVLDNIRFGRDDYSLSDDNNITNHHACLPIWYKQEQEVTDRVLTEL